MTNALKRNSGNIAGVLKFHVNVIIEEFVPKFLNEGACACVGVVYAMNVNCITYETGAGRHQMHQAGGQKRPRSGGSQLPTMGESSTTSTMQSTTAILHTETADRNRDQSNLKGAVNGGKGTTHYGNSSSIELYFAWFSAITFVGELAIGKC